MQPLPGPTVGNRQQLQSTSTFFQCPPSTASVRPADQQQEALAWISTGATWGPRPPTLPPTTAAATLKSLPAILHGLITPSKQNSWSLPPTTFPAAFAAGSTPAPAQPMKPGYYPPVAKSPSIASEDGTSTAEASPI